MPPNPAGTIAHSDHLAYRAGTSSRLASPRSGTAYAPASCRSLSIPNLLIAVHSFAHLVLTICTAIAAMLVFATATQGVVSRAQPLAGEGSGPQRIAASRTSTDKTTADPSGHGSFTHSALNVAESSFRKQTFAPVSQCERPASRLALRHERSTVTAGDARR